jgi:hypothetical protein
VIPADVNNPTLARSSQMKKRKDEWMKHRSAQPEREQQLEWDANIVEYVQYVHKKTSIHAGTQNGTAPPSLGKEVPILSPRFLPPTYLHLQLTYISNLPTSPKAQHDTYY